MQKAFQQYIAAHQLFTPDALILVGVSGGTDSVVLLNLLARAGYHFAVAHCNFHLRGTESDADAEMVRELAKTYGCTFHTTDFDTLAVASEQGISIEMAARDLRYDWFESLRKTHGYDCIAVAHHRDDSLETFFLNLARGTGLRGLTGIQPRNGFVVRPLLFASRQEITAYREKEKLSYREDSSNTNTDFQRNRVRHQLMPLMETLNPSFRKTLKREMELLSEVSTIFDRDIEAARQQVVKTSNDTVYLRMDALRTLHPLRTYLYEFLRPFHFKSEVIPDVIHAMDGESGLQFFSSTHRMVRDRNAFIIHKLETEIPQQNHYIEAEDTHLQTPFSLKISRVNYTSAFTIPRTSRIACIDADKISFPLMLRRWKKGEYFKPLGMQGMKKLSDFFIDQKMSLPDKEQTWILDNGGEVVWICGKRIDDRYKIGPSTKTILLLEML